MKKFVSGVLAAVLLTAGFVAFSGQGAQAAPSRGCTQYTINCAATKVALKGSNLPKTKKPYVKVTVRAAGTVTPKGTLTITVKGKSFTKAYKGKTVTVKLPWRKVGKFRVRVAYKPAASSPTKPSVATTWVKIRRR